MSLQRNGKKVLFMAGRKLTEFSVSELSTAIKRAMEDKFPFVQLRGEISGYRGPHSSGHAYFALKDANARIDAIIWKSAFDKLKVKPEEGMEIVASGRVTTFAGKSSYQIVIERFEAAGIGALLAQLEERKKKFTAEGLFDEDKKKKTPFLPSVIGIVTSPTGAVIQDMMHGFEERFPAHVVVWPVKVQGPGSGQEVAEAVCGFNQLHRETDVPRPDVIIVARGGGSLEDLWGFNEECVVRAVAQSDIPVISAVGHETDWTLIDLVADARAPTPTKAAEWAVPKLTEQQGRLHMISSRMNLSIVRELESRRQSLEILFHRLPSPDSLVGMVRQRLDYTSERLEAAIQSQLRDANYKLAEIGAKFEPKNLLRAIDSLRQQKLNFLLQRMSRAQKSVFQFGHQRTNNLAALLNSLGHEKILKRGFALVRSSKGAILTSRAQLEEAKAAVIVFADGKTNVIVDDNGTNKKPAKKKRKEKKEEKQGSLFNL